MWPFFIFKYVKRYIHEGDRLLIKQRRFVLCFSLLSRIESLNHCCSRLSSMKHKALDKLAFRGILVRWRILTVVTHPGIILIRLDCAHRNRAGFCLGLISGGRAPMHRAAIPERNISYSC